ncbi:MAG: hypothetical protein GDA65_09395 [Nitrospira sp. CR1.1]|jgi:hypothetical protein|nr:hypothetical protein [Nitrospira sp. CR1.1]
MVDAGLSFGMGLLIGGLGLMLGWGLLWLVVGAIGLARQTSGWPIFMSSVSSTALAGLALAVVFWTADAARLSSPALHVGLAGIPLALLAASACRLRDGRRIGPAFVEGSRLMLHQLLGMHQEGGGCGHCHEQPVEEHPCHQKPCFEQSCHEKPCEGKL